MATVWDIIGENFDITARGEAGPRRGVRAGAGRGGGGAGPPVLLRLVQCRGDAGDGGTGWGDPPAEPPPAPVPHPGEGATGPALAAAATTTCVSPARLRQREKVPTPRLQPPVSERGPPDGAEPPAATPGILFAIGGNVTLQLRGLALGCSSLRLPPRLCSVY